MEFYIAIDGKKDGPFSQFRVGELLRSGEITKDSLGWHRGMDEWLRLEEIPALEVMIRSHHRKPVDLEDERTEAPGTEEPQPLAGSDETESPGTGAPMPLPPGETATMARPGIRIANEVKPFTRFWARTFDYMMVTALVWMFSDIQVPVADPDLSLGDLLTRYSETFNDPEWVLLARLQFFSLLIWHLVEGVLLHVFGTTPGKMLFGIRIRGFDGKKPPVLRAIGRSFYVYFLGVGLYQIPFSLIAMTFGFFRLMSTGMCPWDQQLRLQVEHPPMGFVRIVLAICAFFALIVLQSLKFS